MSILFYIFGYYSKLSYNSGSARIRIHEKHAPDIISEVKVTPKLGSKGWIRFPGLITRLTASKI